VSTTLNAFRLVVSVANSKISRESVVLARNRTFASYLALKYSRDRLAIQPAGLFEDLSARWGRGGKPTPKDLRSFYTELGSALGMTQNIPIALKSVAATIRSAKLADAVVEAIIATENAEGADKALDCLLTVLPVEHVERLRASMRSNGAEAVAKDLALSCDKRAKITGKILQSLVTPAVTVILAIALSLFVAIAQIPQLARIFKQAHAPLPLPTQLLAALVDWIRVFPLLAVVIVAAPASLFWFIPWLYRSYPWVQDKVDSLPIVGPLMAQLRWSKILRTVAMLLNSNITILKTLDMVKRGTTHFRTRKFLEGVRAHIGTTYDDLFDAARKNEEILNGVDTRWIDLIPLGEKTGSQGDLLDRVAKDYEERSEATLEFLPKLVEYASLILAAIIVGGVVAAVVLPTFRLGAALK
jgi:type IV pilus assembly protein PilC